MEINQNTLDTFALSEDGPIYEWLKKKGLLEGPMKLAILTICLTWLPLAIITAIEGTFIGGTNYPFLTDVSMQVRLFIALPMLILIKPFIEGRVAVVLKYLSDSLLKEEEREKIVTVALSRARRLTSSTLSEIALLLIVIGLTTSLVKGGVYVALATGSSWMASTDGVTQTLSHAGFWAIFFSIPVFQYFLLQWLWRYIVWMILLFRLSKKELNLPPTHADRSCGLGVLALAQVAFNMVFVVGSVILSGQFIEQLLADPDSYSSIRGVAIGYIVLSIILVVFPLLFFMGNVLKTKNTGLVNLSNLGAGLSRKFEREWVNELPVEQKPTADPVNPSMIYDYAGMYDYLHEIRPLPITLRDVISMAIMLFLPFIPILFIHFSVAELVQKIAGMLML